MKNLKKFSNRAIALSFAMLLAACGSYSSPTSPTSTDTVTSSIAGNWIVSSLVQGEENKTSQFNGYTLRFTSTDAESGTVIATRNNSQVEGTWRHSPAVTYYGSSSTESIVLSLGMTTPFDRITGTWNVVSSNNTNLSLTSPEIREQMNLVLTKQQ
jgi:hypothetical protein